MALPEPEHLLRTVSGINPIRGLVLASQSHSQHGFPLSACLWFPMWVLEVWGNHEGQHFMIRCGECWSDHHSWDLADGDQFSASWSGQRTRNWEKSLPMFINCSWEIGPQTHRRSLDKPCLRFWFIMAIVITEAKENPHCYQPLQMNHHSKRVFPELESLASSGKYMYWHLG